MVAIVGTAGAVPDVPALALLPGGQLASVSRRDTIGSAMQIKHRGLRALHERGDGSRLSAGLIPRLRRILLRLEGVTRPGHTCLVTTCIR